MLATQICVREVRSEKVKVLNLIRKEKKKYAEVSKTHVKNKSSNSETVKVKKFTLVLLSYLRL